MRAPTLLVITGLLCTFGLTSPVPANAQGCTLGLPSSIENAIDSLVLGACDRHDDCWRTNNPPAVLLSQLPDLRMLQGSRLRLSSGSRMGNLGVHRLYVSADQ